MTAPRLIAVWAIALAASTPVLRAAPAPELEATPKKVIIIPIKGDIEPALVYVVRRGVKEAAEQKADALVLHMDTNGGRVDSTGEIMTILHRFEPAERTYTLIDTKAFSAGAFISASTRHIFMTPGSVIGAATPILSTGQEMPKAIEEKMTSGVRGLVRAAAERHGHNTAVFDAMVDRDQGLSVEGKEIVAKGKILTLTAQEAQNSYGKPPKPLLSKGTVASLDALLEREGLAGARRIEIVETGFETLARWVVKISPILMLAGIVGVYVEMKTPGFGVMGLAGGACFLLFFFGHYIAGLSGHETAVFFVVGVALVLLELLVMPGAVAPALLGSALMLGALLMAMVDRYPADPFIPTIPQLKLPMLNLGTALCGAVVAAGLLARYLPSLPLMRPLVLEASAAEPPTHLSHAGALGVAATPLKPSGKARFGDDLVDVVSQGEFIDAGARVAVVSEDGDKVVVERRG